METPVQLTTKKLSRVIESLLFTRATPLTIKQIAAGLNVKESAVKDALEELDENLTGGTRLFQNDNKFEIVSNPANTPYLEKFTKASLPEKLSKIGLETLAIIAYRGPLTRFGIEEIRGVNCVWILRRLMIRGLIQANRSGRKTVYTVSGQLIKHLGLKSLEELPEYKSRLKPH